MTALTGSASHRRYFRLSAPDGRSAIGVQGTDEEENRAFITLSRHFSSKGIRVPKVLVSEGLCYLQEDLGSRMLSDALSAGRATGKYDPEEQALLRKTIAALPKIQVEGARGLDWSVCYPQPAFDARMVDFDLNYFKYDLATLSFLVVLSYAIETCIYNKLACGYLGINLAEKSYFDFELEPTYIYIICFANIIVAGYLTYKGIRIVSRKQ